MTTRHITIRCHCGHLISDWHECLPVLPPHPPDVTEVEELRAWKRDAIRVLAEWETVWEALDRPGPLGTSKAAACAAAVRRLTQEAAR